MGGLDDTRRQAPSRETNELIERVSAQLVAWHLREPAMVLLAMHAPLGFLGSQLLLTAQPFLGMFTGDALARDLALLLEDPQNIERIADRLSQLADGV